jgi:pimeloyl-ACP methyl ester carboxylesterase
VTSLKLIKLTSGALLEMCLCGHAHAPVKVLFFQGFGCSIHLMPNWNTWLEENDICLIAFNRPGIGKTSLKKKYSVDEYVSDVNEALTKVGVGKINVLGWSAGSVYASHYATKFSTLVESLILLNPAPVFQHSSYCQSNRRWRLCSWVIRYVPTIGRIAARVVAKKVRNKFGDKLRASAGPLDVDHQLMHDELSTRQNRGEGVFLDSFAICQHKPEEVSKLLAPVYLWHGSSDTVSPFTLASEYCRLLSQSKVNILPGEGHMAIITSYKEVLTGSLKLSAGRAGGERP